jgi:aspartyl-tRNA(Asn)/glutamyl-tRNA(Gln) amidotransferase subunit A
LAKSKVIGVPRKLLEKGVDADVLASFEQTLIDLSKRGYTIQDIETPLFENALEMYYIINPAEVSTNLARFDGIRYGHSVAAPTIGEVYAQSRGSGFGPEVRRRILVGTFVLSAGYADAYYRKARLMREAIQSDLDIAFSSVDAIALPTSPILPWKFGEKSDPIAMYAADIFTVPVNLAGVPAISVPSGTIEQGGKKLPVGFQIIAPHRSEQILFEIGKSIESA